MPERVKTEIRIINPCLLMDLGYEFNIYLVKSKSIQNIFKIMPELKVEAYQVVGPFDIICKHFQGSDTLQTLFSRNKISWYAIQEWRIKRVERYYFQSNLDYTHWSVVNDKTLQGLRYAQTNWSGLSSGMKKELIDNNYVLDITLNIEKYRTHQLSRVFTFISFPKAVGEAAMKRNEELRKFLLPAFGNIVASLYWGDEGETAQCAMECEGSNIWEILDMATYKLHQYFGEGIATDTFLLKSPLFDEIIVDLPKKWPTVEGKGIGDVSGEFEEYLNRFPDIYDEILNALECYGHNIDFIKRSPIHINIVMTILFYQQCRNDINEIRKYDSPDYEAIQEVVQRALADMLFGVLKAEGSYIARGAMLIGPKLELMFRRTLAAVAFSKLRNGELVKQALKADTVKKNVFPDSLKTEDIIRMINLWNQNYPEDAFATEKMLEEWSKFRPVRNIGGHALSADLVRVREDAPLGFGLIAKLLKTRSQLPEKFKYDLE